MVERRRNPDIQIDHLVDIAVDKTLTKIGFDMSAPTAIQADIRHLRRSRELCELIQNKLVIAVLLLCLSSTVGAAWVGLAFALSKQQEANAAVMEDR